jgi:hypothetical protein
MERFKQWVDRAFRMLLPLYAFLCILTVAAMPTNKYVWMMDDTPADPIKFCALPLDGDGALEFLLIATPLLGGLCAAGIHCWVTKRRRFYIWLSLGLVVLCIAKVFRCRIGL